MCMVPLCRILATLSSTLLLLTLLLDTSRNIDPFLPCAAGYPLPSEIVRFPRALLSSYTTTRSLHLQLPLARPYAHSVLVAANLVHAVLSPLRRRFLFLVCFWIYITIA
jgi:hypothetical protein